MPDQLQSVLGIISVSSQMQGRCELQKLCIVQGSQTRLCSVKKKIKCNLFVVDKTFIITVEATGRKKTSEPVQPECSLVEDK